MRRGAASNWANQLLQQSGSPIPRPGPFIGPGPYTVNLTGMIVVGDISVICPLVGGHYKLSAEIINPKQEQAFDPG